MATNRKIQDELRNSELKKLAEYLTNRGDDVLKVGNGKICIPAMCGDDECYVMFTISIPKGSAGESFDGYAEAVCPFHLHSIASCAFIVRCQQAVVLRLFGIVLVIEI